MCDVKGCEREGHNVPQIIFKIRDRFTRKKWEIPAVVGIKVCDDCKQTITLPEHAVADGGARIERALLAMRQSAVILSKRLGWTTTSGKDWRKLQGMQPS